MSVSVPLNKDYGTIPQDDTNTSISSWSDKDCVVCSGKNESFCSPLKLKLCIFFSSGIILILLFLFVSGVMYINLKDGIYGGFIGFNNIISLSNSKHKSKVYIVKNIDLDECLDPVYSYEEENQEIYYSSTSDSSESAETSLRNYDDIYYCYTSESDCEDCLVEFEENGECPYDCRSETDDRYEVGCFGSCSRDIYEIDGSNRYLYCFYTQDLQSGTDYECDDDDGGCYSYDSIVTKVIYIHDGTSGRTTTRGIDTQDVMINDIKLGDYVITGIDGQYSKVIDRSHFSIYDRSTETIPLLEICFDTSTLNNTGSLLYNCIKMSNRHLIYVNGSDLDSLNKAENIKIGDYLYHTGLNQFVQVNEINSGIEDYYRTIITEDGNIVINNGFYASTITQSKSSKSSPKESHLNMVRIMNGFYKVFTLNGIYEGLWESEWFDHILRLPGKNAIEQWMGHSILFSKKYPYPVISMICLQCIGCGLIYIISSAMLGLFRSTKSVSL